MTRTGADDIMTHPHTFPTQVRELNFCQHKEVVLMEENRFWSALTTATGSSQLFLLLQRLLSTKTQTNKRSD